MKHIDVLDKVIGYTFGDPINPVELEFAREHLSSCKDCLKQLGAALSLLEDSSFDLIGSPSISSGCIECRKYIPTFAEWEETITSEQFPEIARHLSECTECNEQLEILRTWLISTDIISPPPIPTFGERYMSPFTRDTPLWERIGDNVVCLIATIQVKVSESGAYLGRLEEILQPYRLASIVVRGAPVLRSEGLSLDDPIQGVKLDIRLVGRNEILLRTLLTEPKLSLEGGRVLLVAGLEKQRLLQRIKLPSDGEVRFPLPEGNCIVCVELGEKIWKIPIRVESE